MKDIKQNKETNTQKAILENSTSSSFVWNSYKVIARRNYYGEIQEEERVIQGETLERAKFYFNNTSLFWRVAYANKK